MSIRGKSWERAFKSMLMMPTCRVSLMLVTRNYLDDYYNGDPAIVTQVNLSKQLNQPVILMLDQDLTPNERRQAENIFEDHKVIARIIFDGNNVRKTLPELFEALKPFGVKPLSKTKAENT